MMFAAQNYVEVVPAETEGFIMKAECGDLKIEFHTWDMPEGGRRGIVKVDDGTGLIVLDSEVNIMNLHDPAVVSTYIKGDWEVWVPEPRSWVHPLGL
jgi:hypothetical protein